MGCCDVVFVVCSCNGDIVLPAGSFVSTGCRARQLNCLVAVDFPMSKFEKMRTDSANWKLGIVYYCKDDPRIIVRNLLAFGWTWNFAHRGVYFAILAAITAFLTPPYLVCQLGVRSALVIGINAALALIALVFVASRLAQDPEA